MLQVKPAFVGRRQRKIVVNGVKYKAKPQDGCNGCAFGAVTGCACLPVDPHGDALCASRYRDDGVSIIWIKKVNQ